MAACVRIPVTLPNDGEPTKPIIKVIVSTFLKEWSSVDPQSLITKYNDGHAAVHYVVEWPNTTLKSAPKHSKVFIKFHRDEGTGVEAFKHLVPTKDAEAELVCRLGETGYGPSIIGFFQTQDCMRGRIDQLLEGRNLEPEDVQVENIRADIARAYAVLHTMDGTSLAKNSVDSYYEAVTNGLNKYRNMGKLKSLAREGGVDIDELVEYDFATRLGQVVSRLQSIGAKAGWCAHDVQFGNVLVKYSPRQGESRVALIDLEFAFRNYRAFDIGGHWFQKMFKWDSEVNKIVDCRPYTDNEKKHFCVVYAEKWNEVTGQSDTWDQVFAEASLGYLLALTFDIHFMLMAMDEDENTDPLDALGLNKLFSEFKEKYVQFGFEADR